MQIGIRSSMGKAKVKLCTEMIRKEFGFLRTEIRMKEVRYVSSQKCALTEMYISLPQLMMHIDNHFIKLLAAVVQLCISAEYLFENQNR